MSFICIVPNLTKWTIYKLTFYLMIIMSIGTYIFGLTTDSLVFAEMDYKAWILSVAISLIITLGAVPLFKWEYAVRVRQPRDSISI